MEPALGVDRERGLLGILVVADEPRRPAHEDLAASSGGSVLARLRVDDRGAPSRQRHAVRRQRALEWVGRLPIETKPPHSVLPNEETCGTYGSRSCISAAARASRRRSRAAARVRSASAKPGSFCTASQIVSNAGKATVQRSALELLERDVGIEVAADMDERRTARRSWREA